MPTYVYDTSEYPKRLSGVDHLPHVDGNGVMDKRLGQIIDRPGERGRRRGRKMSVAEDQEGVAVEGNIVGANIFLLRISVSQRGATCWVFPRVLFLRLRSPFFRSSWASSEFYSFI